jgi:hypothetical protein
MTAKESIAAYIAAQTAINDQQDSSIEELIALAAKEDASIDGIGKDMQAQADLIAKLQAGPDTWTPADQANLDALQARSQQTLAKVAAMKTASQAKIDKLAALDALANPAPPPPPVVAAA